jgi:hypothetical protein
VANEGKNEILRDKERHVREETGVLQPQIKDHQSPPVTVRSWESDRRWNPCYSFTALLTP